MKKLFTERHGQGKPCVAEVLDETTRNALLALVSSRIDDEWFGLSFPNKCSDGYAHAGTDLGKLREAMKGYGVLWPTDADRNDLPADGTLTAQRGGELLQMRWMDIDPKTHFWTIPGEFVKNAHGRRVHLNHMARELLAVVPRDERRVWVFPKSFMGDYKHVGRRLAQRTRADIVAHNQVEGRARDRADIRGHDLRRTAATLMASGGVPRFVISRILNHSEEKDITRVYDRYSYDAEKKAAMEFWNRQLTAILKSKSVAALRRFAR